MGTLVIFFTFCLIVVSNPLLAVVIYFIHWAYCKVVGKPTMFDRIEAAIKRGFKAAFTDEKTGE